MKKLLTFAIALLFSFPIFAATMNYQAVINDADGKPAADRNVGLKFSIVSNGNSLYTEEAVVKTNAVGLVEYSIGSTNEVQFTDLNWNASNLMLEVAIDLNGGTNYTSIYSSSIQSVPLAICAQRSADSDMLNAKIDELTNYVDYTRNDLMSVKEELSVVVTELDYRVKDLQDMNAYTQEDLNDLKNRVYDLTDRVYDLTDRTDDILARTTELDYRVDESVNSLKEDMLMRMDDLQAKMMDYIYMLENEINILREQINQ